MWRLAVLLVATVLLESGVADIKPTDDLTIRRLKRSPHQPRFCDDCGLGYYRPGPPPPPPPQFYFSSSPSAPEPPRPPTLPYQNYQNYPSYPEGNQPCATCGVKNGAFLSFSNAESETGDAIAVAVAKAKS